MCRSIHVGVQFSKGIDPHTETAWWSGPRDSSLYESEKQVSVKRRFWTGQLIIDVAPLNIVLPLLLLKLEKPTEICNLPLFTINVKRLCNFCGFYLVQLQVEFLRWVWVKTTISMKIDCFDVSLPGRILPVSISAVYW